MLPISNAGEALLEQLFADQLAPMSALGRLAAHHGGQPQGFMPFRSGSITAGPQHFPEPEDVTLLISGLMVRTRVLFDSCRDAVDDLHVAGFLLWGLTAVHPFENGNGRTSCDFVQYTLMARWRTPTPPLGDLRNLLRDLVPVFRHIEPENDGSAEGHLRQLQTLLAIFETATLEDIKKNEHFGVIAKVLATTLKPS